MSTPGRDEAVKLARIKERHGRDSSLRDIDHATAEWQTHRDRAYLLAELERLQGELKDAEEEANHYIQHTYVDAGANNRVTWKERCEKAEAQMRTPGTIEICQQCNGHRGNNDEWWKACGFPGCPIACAGENQT